MNDSDILIRIQEAIRQELYAEANKEIENLKHKFECDMGKVKNEIVGNLVNAIDIITRKDDFNDKIVIQIVIKR